MEKKPSARQLLDRAKEKFVLIKEIMVGERHRKVFAQIDSMAESIKEKGLLNPITIAPLAEAVDGFKYILIAGERRLRATVSLGNQDIRARILDTPVGELELREIELLENIKRSDMTYPERCTLTKAIHDLEVQKYGPKISTKKDAAGHSAADTAEMLNSSAATISRDLEIAKAMEQFPTAPWHLCKTQKDARGLCLKLQRQVQNSVLVDIVDAKNRGSDIAQELCGRYRLGDCIKGILETIPHESIDLVEFDPPYAIDLNANKESARNSGYNEVKEDAYEVFMKQVLYAAYDACKPDAWLLCWFALHPWYDKIWKWIEEAGFYVDAQPLVWIKGTGVTARPYERLASSYEPAFFARKGNPRINKPGTNNVFISAPVNADKKIHPTERPMILMRELLSTFCKPGSKILVPCAGSGVTLLAAYEEKMDAIGFDLTQVYQDAYKLRVDKYLEGK